jgi:hypothetical protein
MIEASEGLNGRKPESDFSLSGFGSPRRQLTINPFDGLVRISTVARAVRGLFKELVLENGLRVAVRALHFP